MSGALLFWTYSTVMVVALGFFMEAYRSRKNLARHRRLAMVGVILTLGGIVAVILATYFFGWRVPKRYPTVVRVHRVFALGAALIVVVTAYTGWRRIAWHKQLYKLFFPLYVITLITALIGYRP